MNKDILISIIIPTYNEEDKISLTLKSIHRYFENKKFEYEVLVVDDGSTDNTLSIVKNISSKFNNFIIIKNIINMGKGYSVKRGMMEASGALKLFMMLIVL